ncbi:MAG TPA: hypothetical protein VGP63_30330, partial [Planctomycetaceae bacterium]|nr:hypothetical protein [Planctomycetaceae bacterium]
MAFNERNTVLAVLPFGISIATFIESKRRKPRRKCQSPHPVNGRNVNTVGSRIANDETQNA